MNLSNNFSEINEIDSLNINGGLSFAHALGWTMFGVGTAIVACACAIVCPVSAPWALYVAAESAGSVLAIYGITQF